MKPENDTYTYTARSISDPDRVLTFTLVNSHLQLEITGLAEKMERIQQAEEKPEAVKTQLIRQMPLAAPRLWQAISGPLHVGDVHARLEDDHLTVNAWQRTAGLRLAPVIIRMGAIDNPPAAEAFIEELDARQEEAEHPAIFFGPLDYWLGWIGLAIGLGFLLRRPDKQETS